jgi:hypothetical protein
MISTNRSTSSLLKRGAMAVGAKGRAVRIPVEAIDLVRAEQRKWKPILSSSRIRRIDIATLILRQ